MISIRNRVVLLLSSTAVLGSFPFVWSNQAGQNPAYNYYNYGQQQQHQQPQGEWQQTGQNPYQLYQEDAGPHQTEAPPSTERKEAPLPPGWSEHIDPASGQPYYYNAAEGITTWDRPSVPETEEIDSSVVQQPDEPVEDGTMKQQLQSQEESQPEPEQESPSSYESTEQQPNGQVPGKADQGEYSPGPQESQYQPPGQRWGQPQSQAPPTQQSGGWGMPKAEQPPYDNQQRQPWSPGQEKPSGPDNIEKPEVKSESQPKPGWGMPQSSDKEPDDKRVESEEQKYEQTQNQPKPWGMQQEESVQRPPLGGRPLVPPTQQQNMAQPTRPYQGGPPPTGMQPPPYSRQGPQGQYQQPGNQSGEQQRPEGQPPVQRGPLPGPDQRPGQMAGQPQSPYGQRPTGPFNPEQRPGQQMPYGQYPPGQRPPYQPQQSQGAQQGGPPYGQQYGQYGQYGQFQPSPYGQYNQNQVVEAGPQTVVREALGKTWQSLLGFGNRTKEVIDVTTSNVLSGAKEAGETISSTSASWWSQAKGAIGSVFESAPEEQSQYSLSGRYGSPDQQGYSPQKPYGYAQPQGPPGYPQQGGRPPQQPQYPYGQAPPSQQQQPQPQQPPPGRFPPGYTPPQPRTDPAYPHQQSQQDPRQRPPPLQNQWGAAGGQRPGMSPPGYGPYPGQAQGPPRQQQPPGQQRSQQPPQQEKPEAWQHPGLGYDGF